MTRRVRPFGVNSDGCRLRASPALIATDRTFIKHGYLPPSELIEHLRDLAPSRVLVCGVQTETCVLAAGFALFDAGLHPTLLAWLTKGSSLDRSGALGVRLWQHHFGSVIDDPEGVKPDGFGTQN